MILAETKQSPAIVTITDEYSEDSARAGLATFCGIGVLAAAVWRALRRRALRRRALRRRPLRRSHLRLVGFKSIRNCALVIYLLQNNISVSSSIF